MEAKDTVRTISFSEACRRTGEARSRFAYEEGRRAGIKEVVEWIPKLIEAIKEEMWADDWGIEHSVIYPDMLDELVKKKTNAKLKEWGL